jgi:hypothetical protein
MIAIAALAVLIGFLVEMLHWAAGPRAAPPISLAYYGLGILLGPLFFSFIFFAIDSWRRGARHEQFTMGENSPSRTADPTRSGETKKV